MWFQRNLLGIHKDSKRICGWLILKESICTGLADDLFIVKLSYSIKFDCKTKEALNTDWKTGNAYQLNGCPRPSSKTRRLRELSRRHPTCPILPWRRGWMEGPPRGRLHPVVPHVPALVRPLVHGQRRVEGGERRRKLHRQPLVVRLFLRHVTSHTSLCDRRPVTTRTGK